MTLRRVALLASRLPDESCFKSEVEDRIPISGAMAAGLSVYEALTGKRHPAWDVKKKKREAAEREAAMPEARARARAHREAKAARRKK